MGGGENQDNEAGSITTAKKQFPIPFFIQLLNCKTRVMQDLFRLDVITSINILGAAQGIFLGIILLTRKSNSIANRVLGMAMFTLAIGILSTEYYANEYYFVFPHFIAVTVYFPFLYGPILYLYAKLISSGKNIFKKKYLLHFAPFFSAVLYTMPFYFRSGSFKINFMIQMSQKPRLDIVIIDNLKIIHGLAYVFLTIQLVHRHKKKVMNSFSNIDKISLSWLKNLSILVIGVRDSFPLMSVN